MQVIYWQLSLLPQNKRTCPHFLTLTYYILDERLEANRKVTSSARSAMNAPPKAQLFVLFIQSTLFLPSRHIPQLHRTGVPLGSLVGCAPTSLQAAGRQDHACFPQPCGPAAESSAQQRGSSDCCAHIKGVSM